MYTSADHTFVVCAYKENPYLEETILSLESQEDLGSILISTSTPNDYIRRICEKHDIQMIVNPEPHLAGDDWNYGYDAADTPLVTIAHQDDLYEPGYLRMVLDAFNRYSPDEVSLVFTDYYEIRSGEKVCNNALLSIKRKMNWPFRYSKLNGLKFVKRRVLAFGDSICCPSVTLCKGVAGDSVFDTEFVNSCDYKTWVDLANTRGRFVYIPERLMCHRIYEESATTKNLEADIRKGEDRAIMSTLWPRPVASAINSIYALSEKSNKV